MGRKVFISVLGTSDYRPCEYYREQVSFGKSRFIQESTLNYLNSRTWPSDSKAYILLTQSSESRNWNDNGLTDHNGNTLTRKGLQAVLRDMNLPFGIEPITNIPEGNNEEEIWNIFERVYNVIEPDDELYFDITHGYRYLPMLILVLCNYSRFLKHTTIKSITYGNFEVSQELGHGVIVDLKPLSELQDWTFAAGQFVNNGNVDELVKKSSEKYRPLLKESQGTDTNAQLLRKYITNLNTCISQRQTCRGKEIISSGDYDSLCHTFDSMQNSCIRPLMPILKSVQQSLQDIVPYYNVNNALSAAKWCYNNKYYQQSATLLQEYVISYFCIKYNLEIDNLIERQLVGDAVYICNTSQCEINDEINTTIADNVDLQMALQNLVNDTELQSISATFTNMAENLRNDLNHSGMRQNSSKPEKLIKDLGKYLERLSHLGKSEDIVAVNHFSEEQSTLLINLSNHPFEKWSDNQKSAAVEQYGEVQDLPFPNVNPDGDADYISSLADEYFRKVKEMSGKRKVTIHLMGEMNLSFTLLDRFREAGYECIASTTERVIDDSIPGQKTVFFRFVRFRPYN